MDKSEYTLRELSLCVVAFRRPNWIVQFVPDDECTDKPFREEYTSTQLLHSCSFLRLMNMRGHHVYARPDTTRIILIDDVDEYMLDQLTEDGLRPALVIMTSPDNYQAWIIVSDEDIPHDLATAAAQILADRYSADRGSAESKHLGRLPQLTNRKRKYRYADGKYPWTRIVGSFRNKVAPNAANLLEDARTLLSSTRRACVHHNSSHNSSSDTIHINHDMTPDQASAIYNGTLTELQSYGWIDQLSDRSRVDFAVAKHLYLQYGYYAGDVSAVILHGSDKGRERGENYAIRTAQRAYVHNRLHSHEVA